MTGEIDSVQVVYNIFDQNPEDELFPACELTETAGDWRARAIRRGHFDRDTHKGKQVA